MKVYLAIPIICAASTTRTGQGHNQRRLEVNKQIVDTITHTEVLSAALPILVYPEGPTDASSRTSSCSSPSAQWLQRQINNVSDEDQFKIFDWYLYTLPFAYKLFVETEPKGRQEYFGLDGEYTREIGSIRERAQDFWSHAGVDEDLRVFSAHGSDLADRHAKLVPTLELMFSRSYNDDYTVLDHAADIQELIARLPGGYNFPLLTFNAFATYESDQHDYPSIIIGDGYFEFQQSVGLGSEGPEYALTHEHAHHLQYLLGVPEENDNGPSQNARRQELMADAFSAYFLAHDSGGDMTAEQLANIHSVAYSVGDCETSNDGHHGTPHQRRCATKWGASIADSRGVATFDLIELQDGFDEWYEELDDLDDLCEHANSAGYPATHSLQVVAVLFGSGCIFGF